ncbi:UDP-N-acetylmuramoyl-L-alanyl-D-glutamate--2,6-diaminopimelate ligase [Vibrio porteresiae]|uniref:UDP-N-acetylmuramoyl-L-alanyl-D-glutamate--2,6-diaminopimelate ligase n=1 Tax=Vibrio porteresiae DSM 19223 TaxID=1123496 RepID=A0ABZ0QDV5_9VIBR|nr:UDP-N-acetylmuramoyl-L-alanyl-D-glutamate--2,6-diaminopimelate ligase [Vibrio porteresiae]WPC74618.1 UDP-N-acetylmuramoyl-L-alanyl-D-glutamate--2,6-diaminopimelate ligase [Vibrio porteresiae DSM 19223]
MTNKGKALADLLSPWVTIEIPAVAQLPVTELHLDSRHVTSGDTFVAIIGHAVDGRKFIAKAIEQGANAVIAQADQDHAHGMIDYVQAVPVVYVEKLHEQLSALAGRLYGIHHNRPVAVTGTNGKTTITQLIAQWMTLTGVPAAVMGTTGNGFLDALVPAANTTGNAIDIQAQLASLAEQGAQYTAMEVSSHGLVQGRVKALHFSAGVFTNLSRDHLDYHGTMEAYAEAKKSLFTEHSCDAAIINADDSVGASWLAQLPHAVGVSLHHQPISERAVWATQVHYADSGIHMEFAGAWGKGVIDVPLIGEFNANNVLVAFTTLLVLGFDKATLLATANQLQPVIGRMELFQAPNKAKVVVDYAHTPDALEKALTALRVHCNGQLWAICGCGGDRDKGKRPLMAQVAEKYADNIILTDDNPRSEQPEQIIKDMQAGLNEPSKALVEHHRFQALEFALAHASADDIILLAGKGHEDYQIIGDKTIHYSDRESAQTLLELKE